MSFLRRARRALARPAAARAGAGPDARQLLRRLPPGLRAQGHGAHEEPHHVRRAEDAAPPGVRLRRLPGLGGNRSSSAGVLQKS